MVIIYICAWRHFHLHLSHNTFYRQKDPNLPTVNLFSRHVGKLHLMFPLGLLWHFVSNIKKVGCKPGYWVWRRWHKISHFTLLWWRPKDLGHRLPTSSSPWNLIESITLIDQCSLNTMCKWHPPMSYFRGHGPGILNGLQDYSIKYMKIQKGNLRYTVPVKHLDTYSFKDLYFTQCRIIVKTSKPWNNKWNYLVSKKVRQNIFYIIHTSHPLPWQLCTLGILSTSSNSLEGVPTYAELLFLHTAIQLIPNHLKLGWGQVIVEARSSDAALHHAPSK